MAQKILTVNPAKVAVPKGLYPRRRMPVETDVQHLRQLGEKWHTKVVTANGGKVLVDGAHRLLAATLDGAKTIEVLDIGKASDDEILRAAIERNATHGKQLSMTEKQDMAVKLVGDQTATELCNLLGVADRTMSRWLADAKDTRKINSVVKARKMLDKGKSMTAIAKELGVARGTLQGWLKEDPQEVAATTTKKPAKESQKSSTSRKTEPATTEIKASELLDETQALIATIGLGIVTECKAAVKCENPDGLHWTDMAALVMKEVRDNFPAKASKAA